MHSFLQPLGQVVLMQYQLLKVQKQELEQLELGLLCYQ